MKTAAKFFIAIGVITTLCGIIAVAVHVICAGNRKYYPVAKTAIEV